MYLKKFLSILTSCLLPMGSIIAQEDHTYIYLCSTQDGTSGLMVATSDDGDPTGKWTTKGLEHRLTSSDYGAWGAGKKMYNPVVYLNSDSTWTLVFDTYSDSSVKAISSSKDLINWSVQEYRNPSEIQSLIASDAVAGEKARIDYKGKKASGTIFKVPTSLVEKLKARQRYNLQRDANNNARVTEDSWRFKGYDTLHISIIPEKDKAHKISDKFIGIFFEDINYSADGGLYAELVQNRDFEYNTNERKKSPGWNATTAWQLSDSAAIKASIETEEPIHPNNPHYLKLTTNAGKQSLINTGFDGIVTEKGDKYNVSLFARSSGKGKVKIALLDPNGRTIGHTTFSWKDANRWNKINGVITATASCDSATLSITPLQHGTIDLDMISLMPQNTFNGRANGLRKDLAQVLADLHPRFVRFPGGCVAHGDGIDNMYDWKGSIGNLEERVGKRNIWGYHQSRGLGYHEYFEFCEDIGAEPLPVLAAGVPCQNSSTPSRHSHDHLTSDGQQCGIPMEQMGAYVQDILDLIEYANGDTTTTWGAKRAQAGHPEPFNLKMIGIGNEDLITDAFKERFLMINNAIKERYPKIEVVGTVGPFYEGPDYETGWKFAKEHNLDAVDEHYYVNPGWYIHNRGFYDNYDRQGTKVYLGEYASHLPDRASTLEAALSIALYLTDVERSGDVVTMTSYAPLLAKKDHTQWKPDLIYFDNTSITLTPDYYVQKMYGTNPGTTYIPSVMQTSTASDDVNNRLGQSIVIDEETGDTILRLVNMTPVVVETAFPYCGTDVEVTSLAGSPLSTEVAEVKTVQDINKSYRQAPYSFTVLRFKNLK